ncbi:MAG: glycerol kinase GlpK [Gemmatales bacterium]|nr:glycerol kinase GlpK [Gemmatales bacterium]MDW8385938.1 glycerol kinase GlpK [Gemmatales bacterium]
MPTRYLLAIDQGTTSTRVIVFDESAQVVASASEELTQHYPKPGWVEHDPEEIWQAVKNLIPGVIGQAGISAHDIAGVGVTNQRETTVLWDRGTGRPIHRAIVWQDRRTADLCRELAPLEGWFQERTGLVLDAYFSGTKIRWLLDHVPGARLEAEAGRLAFGTVDSFLIWRLTGGRVHATDFSNASRTLLFNLHDVAWDAELCQRLEVPMRILPEVRPSSGIFGCTAEFDFLPDGIPIAGVAGDQQAALFGQRCFEAGEAKCTYGTGAFFLQHTGHEPRLSRHRLITTLAATTSARPEYALEGSVFIAGAAVQWLRDGLRMFQSSAEVEALAQQAADAEGVFFVPALVGLGAPHWVPGARGVLWGLTRSTRQADIARAALEGVAWQVVDLVEAAEKDSGAELKEMRVDGGMARNDFFVQMQADLLGRPLVRADQVEATSLGAAFLAGLAVGIWPNRANLRELPQRIQTFVPRLDAEQRRRRHLAWQRAVAATIRFYRYDTHP